MPNNSSKAGIGAVLAMTLGIALPGHAAEGPWRLNDALNFDQGFSLGLVQRTRFENLHDNVQPGTSPNDQVLAIRTLLDIQYRRDRFTSQLELADIRQEWADNDSVISTATVNSRDVLQATVGYRFGANENTWVRLGRFTEDWGSRRLSARNRFRNTINAWDGLVVHHLDEAGNETRFMATEVVRRLPGDRDSLLDNRYEGDESSSAQRFYGIHTSLPNLVENATTEFYLYLLREKDTHEVNTRNRRLNTAGFRIRSAQAPGEFDYEVETVIQTGKIRAPGATDRFDLDHTAFFQYLGVGYSFARPGRPRLMFEFDYASGDSSPNDDTNERFDSLFGPTTFEFGVVGLYNPFNRSNLITPGLRFTINPTPRVDFMAIYRHFWLAQKKDTWGRTRIRDVTGDSGRYLGQHLQLRLRWNVLPGNLQIETGSILLNSENLSNKNSQYFYTSATFTF